MERNGGGGSLIKDLKRNYFTEDQLAREEEESYVQIPQPHTCIFRSHRRFIPYVLPPDHDP